MFLISYICIFCVLSAVLKQIYDDDDDARSDGQTDGRTDGCADGMNISLIFTARCTIVQSAVLRSHFVCPSVRLSVRLSVTLVDCDHIGWNSSTIISRLVRAFAL